MKPILKQLQFLFLFFLVFYLGFYCLSLIFYPPGRIMDTQESSQTIYGTEPKYVVLGRGVLRGSADKIILLGSSNVREGFRPPQLQPSCPGWEIHNLAVGASNITQLRQISRLIYEVLPPDAGSRNIFVIGLWYGLFVDDQTRWQSEDTAIDLERIRFRLAKKEKGRIRPDISANYADYLVYLLRPYLFLDNIINKGLLQPYDKFQETVAARLQGRKNILAEVITDKNSVMLSKDYKKFALEFWNKYMGADKSELREEQFILLNEMVDEIRKNHGKVIMIDLPLPDWHTANSPYFRDYHNKKMQFIEKITASKDVLYFNYQDMNNEADFYDSAHPKPMVTKKWNDRLRHDLQQLCHTLK